MDARRHPPPSRSVATGPWSELAALLPPLPPGGLAACAFSGGLDSRAMLECAVSRYGAPRVLAIHVNHGLQEAAADFESFCAKAASDLCVELLVLRVDAAPKRGESPEEAAREARIAALASACRERRAAFCLVAHHGDDQAETLVLALSRGLGLSGLSGMGERTERHGALLLRPWLGASRAAIHAAATEAGLSWTEDPTNADVRFARNKARALPMPALTEAFPLFVQSAARSMAHCAQAQELLVEVAAEDLARLAGTSSGLDLAKLLSLTRPRQSNLLRHWLRSIHKAFPSQAQSDEALLQISASARGGAIDIKCGHGKLVRSGPLLAFADMPSHRPPSPAKPGSP